MLDWSSDSQNKLRVKTATKDFCSQNNRPNRLTQCCTQFKSPGIKILCVLYLHDNVAFIFLNDMEIPATKRFISKGFELGTTLS